jgi:replication factor A1
MYMPIKALNTFSRDWKIQARISSKGEKRFTKSGGSIFKIELIDMYGTKIEGAFFNEAADAFERKLHENKVYLFSNGTIKMSNKRFSSVKNDFCIIFEKTA